MSKRQPDGYVAMNVSGTAVYFDNFKPVLYRGIWFEDKLTKTSPKDVAGIGCVLREGHPSCKGLTPKSEPRPVYLTLDNPDDVDKLVEVASASRRKLQSTVESHAPCKCVTRKTKKCDCWLCSISRLLQQALKAFKEQS